MVLQKSKSIYILCFPAGNKLRVIEWSGHKEWEQNENSLESFTFCGLEQLEVVKVCDSGIKLFAVDVFDGLTSLREIYIGHNNLGNGTISSNKTIYLHGNKNLEVLELSYNYIHGIPWDMFESLTKLKTLDLSGNL